MMTGSDSDGCRWRTGSSHSRARPPRRRAGSACATAASTSMPRSAPAAIRARSWQRPARASSASIAITARLRTAPALVERSARPARCWSRIASRIWKRSSHSDGAAAVDGVVFDLGVSSMQLDEAARGFSFRLDGPLDMRMGRDGPSAADMVRARRRARSRRHHRHAGRRASRARDRARDRQGAGGAGHRTRRARSPKSLRASCTRAPGAIHPATRTFQALRIFVNDELAELARGLAAAERVLEPSGRLVVVAFHSLEDRIVKTFLAERSRAPAASRHRPEVRRGCSRPFACSRGGRKRRTKPRSRPIRAPARPSCARPSAPMRRRVLTTIETLLPRLPSLADIMRGRP